MYEERSGWYFVQGILLLEALPWVRNDPGCLFDFYHCVSEYLVEPSLVKARICLVEYRSPEWTSA